MNIAGKKVPGWAVYGGVGVAVVGGILYFRRKNSGSSSASSTATDPVTGLPYSMDQQADPLTGMTYLSEAQTYGSVPAAEQALAGQGAGAGAYGAGGGISGYGYGYPTTSITGTGSTTGTTYTSNAQWVQAATAGLTSLGYNGSDVGAALGLYLLGMPLDSAQATIVQTAVAEFGSPPVGSFAIIASPNSQTGSTGAGSGGTTGTGTGTGAGTGTPAPARGGPITVTPADLHTTQVSATSVQVAWLAPTIPAGQGPLTGYTLQVFNANGTPEGTPWTVPASQLYGNAGGLKSRTAYHVNVWCEPARTGGPHASVSFTTK